MKKYSEKAKLAAVEAYRSGQLGLISTANLYEVGVSSLRKWVAAYQVHGVAGIQQKHRMLYSPEFKAEVLQRVRDEDLSYRQAAALFNIRHFNIIGKWERAYERDGMAGLIPYQLQHHKTMMKEIISQPTTQPSNDEARTRQELLDELSFLRLENAYLKKVSALVQAHAKSAPKRPHKSCSN